MLPFWKTILTEWTEKNLPEIYPREEEISTFGFKPLKKILVITGFRRTGKTYLMLLAIKKLLQTYSKKDVFHLNFEDERIPSETGTLTDLLPAFQSFFGQKPKFLFLDEIQNIPLWSKYVRRILDNENMQIFLTGSSSRMSSFELPTELRGRSFEQRVWPLNFREFLLFKNEELDKNKLFALLFHISFSLREQLTKPRKAYFIDNGFINALSTKFSQNSGHLLENLVAWQLRSQKKEIYYFQNERKTDEVDFVVMENDKPKELIQVCFDLSESETQKREFGALVRTGKRFSCQNLKLVYAKKQDNLAIPAPIKPLPIEDFFLHRQSG